MFCHVAQTSDPVVQVKIGVSPPSVSVSSAATPHAARDVVVEVDVYLLICELSGDGIKHLYPKRALEKSTLWG